MIHIYIYFVTKVFRIILIYFGLLVDPYELLSDIFQWTPSHERAKAGRPARTYVQQLCADPGYILEDLLEAMDDREG